MPLFDHAARRLVRQACLPASATALALATAAAAQDEAEGEGPPPALPAPPIVVIGDADAAAAKRTMVVVGSRITKPQRVRDRVIATNTGTPGFTPQSGMDPAGAYTRLLKRETCVAENPAIGEDAACILLEARAAALADDANMLRGLLLPLALGDTRNDAERAAAALMLWQDAARSENPRRMEEALMVLIESATMEQAKEMEAWASLATLSRKFGEREAERARLEQVATFDQPSANALARLAIVKREDGESDADATMRRAIAAIEATGADAPEGWIAFAQQR